MEEIKQAVSQIRMEELDARKRKTEEIDTQYSPPDKESAQWAFEYATLYWDIKAKLYGGWLAVDKKTGNYKIVRPLGSKPMMSPKGVEDVMALINGFTSKIQALSNIDEPRIYDICRDLYKKLAVLFYIRMEDYSVMPEKASVIIRMIMSLFETNMRRSINGRGMLLIGQIERVVENRIEEKPRKRFGII